MSHEAYALAPDGSRVEGFVFDGAAVTWTGGEPVRAGIRFELELDRKSTRLNSSHTK